MHIYTYELSLSARGALTNTAAGTLSLAVRRKERRGNVVRWELLRRCRRIARSLLRQTFFASLPRNWMPRISLPGAQSYRPRRRMYVLYTYVCAPLARTHCIYSCTEGEKERKIRGGRDCLSAVLLLLLYGPGFYLLVAQDRSPSVDFRVRLFTGR